MTTSYSQPSVPSLYFETHSSSNDDTTSLNDNNNDNINSTTPELPSELLSLCLASYANWGDLAKLACVQKSWSNIVMETANQSSTSQWELAMALLNGDCGLEETPKRAVQILKVLSNVTIDENTGKPLTIPKENNSNKNTKIVASEETSAMKKIAECYLEGTGVSQDAAVAVAWMETAYYIGNDSDAAHEMAVIYEYGRYGVEIDVVAAAEWFERSAKLGNVGSMVELGLCYELGAGVEQNDEEALDWYTKAANLGCATGKFSVGEIFEEARGVPQSDAEACIWYYSAAMDGCQDSKGALRRLYDIARIVVPGVTAILNE
jgi:hypothetical protein